MAVRNEPQRCGGGPKLLKADHVWGLRMHVGHPCPHRGCADARGRQPWLDFLADL